MLTFTLVSLAVLVLFTLIRFGAFLVSNALAGQLSEIRRGVDGLSLAVVRGVVTALAADVVALPSCLLLACTERSPGGMGTPILMVHGLYHNRTAWQFFKFRLRRAGFSNLHTFGYNSFTRDFDHALKGMEQKLEALLGKEPDAKVILMGHSLGGLVCRCAAANPRFNHCVAGLITLGSPHKGSDLARFGGNRMARDLIPGRFISRAVAGASDPDCPKLGIYTLTDDYVFPLDMLRTGRTGWQERICSPMGHVWMLYSAEVADMTIDFLVATESAG
ncbi:MULTISPECIES: alpha/beta fold hydrolase [unclassified Pseudodesulfovibrio]|uniref:esterase/lipase family protein n=1 Tax=unclassified Pseudodesulfovibrio TaxID=2661612 RepID=UPI000FEBD558|nr:MULTISPECIES: alpha/beta fold hydrolase [unclassified Pseudodesulfovibrio]MCJ2164292.1 alpha/beta fold hydrolase [Pseudodesulfovibrio sp. S3-i]RWU04503.1 alpha/beta fold hydrolase [Pseudodesulfovibrio sp. S3]